MSPSSDLKDSKDLEEVATKPKVNVGASKTRTRISSPRNRPEDAFALGLCNLTCEREAEEGARRQRRLSIDVDDNDLTLVDHSAPYTINPHPGIFPVVIFDVGAVCRLRHRPPHRRRQLGAAHLRAHQDQRL